MHLFRLILNEHHFYKHHTYSLLQKIITLCHFFDELHAFYGELHECKRSLQRIQLDVCYRYEQFRLVKLASYHFYPLRPRDGHNKLGYYMH